jgi:signal transduction histidine kinase/ActR/RegA family two-component response regulator
MNMNQSFFDIFLAVGGLLKKINVKHFDERYLNGAVLVSLLSVWVLVVIFYYLNRYTKRHYFTVWTAAWLFYALWLTLGISYENPDIESHAFAIRQWCVGVSAMFLLWGGLLFLEKPVWQRQFGWFMVFLLIWSYVSPTLLDRDRLLVQIPVFCLVGCASIFAGVSFYKLRKQRHFVGIGLLFLGFTLWGIYLVTYPFSVEYESLTVVGFLVSAVLQLFIAVSMIVLVLEEVRYTHEQLAAQIQKVRSEKEELQMKILSAEADRLESYDQSKLHSDLQRAYDELRQTQQTMVQRERLLALGQMSSGMAHDINNAISPILGFSELLIQQEEGMSEPALKHLSYIRMAAQDIAQMVARMSEFYRRRDQTEPLRAVDINKLAGEVVELTRPRWRDMSQSQGANVKVTTNLAQNLPLLESNAGELREGLTNILLNSVDALPGGGNITISTRFVETGPPGSGAPGHIVIEIADNGVGMDETTRRRCLEPFYSTKQQRGGTGLGLAMVYGMMERHEGKIEIVSELGRGTTVRLVFPLRQSISSQAQPPAGLAPRSGLRILCVDDEPLLREMMNEILRSQKHKVIVADSGRSGLAQFEFANKAGDPFDLVITDLGMPELDGRELAQRIKEISPKTPVIMLTGWGKVLDEKLGACDAVDIIVTKPPRMKEVNDAIARVMAKKEAKE